MLERERDRIRILLVDGHHLVRQGIRQLLDQETDFEVLVEVDNGLEAVRLARELKPDTVIMEARMPGLDSVEATRRIKTDLPETAVIILTAYQKEEYIIELLGAGAAGYLLKKLTWR